MKSIFISDVDIFTAESKYPQQAKLSDKFKIHDQYDQ